MYLTFCLLHGLPNCYFFHLCYFKYSINLSVRLNTQVKSEGKTKVKSKGKSDPLQVRGAQKVPGS